MFKLIQNGKTIFQSAKKIDAIFEHQNYKRSDRVRVARWHLNVVDTHEVTMRIDSDYVQLDDQLFQGRVVGRNGNIIGEKTAYTGDVTFSYSQDASLAKVEFRTEGYLGLTIAGISWDGQYYKTSGRM